MEPEVSGASENDAPFHFGVIFKTNSFSLRQKPGQSHRSSDAIDHLLNVEGWKHAWYTGRDEGTNGGCQSGRGIHQCCSWIGRWKAVWWCLHAGWHSPILHWQGPHRSTGQVQILSLTCLKSPKLSPKPHNLPFERCGVTVIWESGHSKSCLVALGALSSFTICKSKISDRSCKSSRL